MNWRVDLKTAGLVTLVTLLIWIWAEGESLQRESITGAIQFAGRTDLVVKPEPGFGGSIEVGLEGSNLAISAASRRLLRGPLELQPGEGAVPAEPGAHQLILRDVLREHPDLRTTGVTINATVPRTLTIEIVRLVQRSLPVRVILPPGFEESQGTTVRPPTVTVTLPESLADSIVNETALVRVPEAELRDVMPGQRKRITGLPINLPDVLAGREDEDVDVEPRQVAEVTVDVRAQTDTIELTSVPVWITLPPTQMGRWSVEVVEQDRFIPSVTVTGPRELIARIRAGELPIKAIVELDTQDLDARIEQKAVRFSLLPTGLTFPEPRPVVRLRIEPRLEGGAGGPGDAGS